MPIPPADSAPLKDTQNESDDRQIPIDRVGVRALRYPMQIRDKSRESQHTIATVALTVDLPHHFKGTHMSRFVEVLNEFGPELHVDNIHTILHHSPPASTPSAPMSTSSSLTLSPN
ncbi:MAG: GTP cyclohydrolase, FolE2/MptA family [Verrucomicrobia bacterium]|nr:GTP cyclohydrolase, FolE2/MptA family [Verrucomicrobiota bacterium]